MADEVVRQCDGNIEGIDGADGAEDEGALDKSLQA